MELIVARHELLKKNADALGIEMVDVTAPDPTAEAFRFPAVHPGRCSTAAEEI